VSECICVRCMYMCISNCILCCLFATLRYTYHPNVTPPHYTTLHYTTLHYTTLHYTALHHTTPHYTTLHRTTLHYTTLHRTTPHYTTLHYSHCIYIPVYMCMFQSAVCARLALLQPPPRPVAGGHPRPPRAQVQQEINEIARLDGLRRISIAY
jgi:hypothetical protein